MWSARLVPRPSPPGLFAWSAFGIYHHWETLEDYLVELLARRFDLDTFGCELMLIAEDTLSLLCDPIHEELWEHKRFQLITHTSFRIVHTKEQVRRDEYDDHPKAIWVPARTGTVPALPFARIAEVGLSETGMVSVVA